MCLNPKARYCECESCLDEQISVNGFRNLELYNNSGNPLARWMNSSKWTTTPTSTKIRGECVVSLLRSGARVTKFVVQGAVSGEITC